LHWPAPTFFNLTKDGIGFWLKTKNGYLYHVSDSIPKKLFPINKFRWYLVDIVYDIDKGAYDLEIVEENQRSPVIVLKNQKNASNNPNSVVNIFSFVTDPFTDRSDLTYYVDDVIIGIDEEILKAPFVAPGRKKYFVDMWDEYQFKLRQKPGCLPAIHLYDFGLDDDDIQSLEEHGLLDYLNDVANGKQFPKQQSKHISTEHLDILNGIYQWNQGCRLLANNKPAEALEMFNSSDKNLDYAPILELSRLFSLASLKRWGEVNDGLRNMHFEGLYDQRISVAQAIIGMSNANLQKAEHWLEIPAENIPQEFGDEAINETIKRIWSGEINRDLINIIERYMPEDWEEFYEQALIAEQYFYVLLWQEREKEAADFADRMIERLKFLAAPTSIWLERRGDAAFFMKEYKTTKIYYEKSLGEKKINQVLYGKLSDINYLLGNYDEERQYREKVYGSLVDKKCS